MTKRSSLFAVPSAPEPMLAVPLTAPSEAPRPKQPRAASRVGKRLVTAYVDPMALKQLQLISVEEETTIQALLIEGLNAVFTARGRTRIA